jgi:hypothetical protein
MNAPFMSPAWRAAFAEQLTRHEVTFLQRFRSLPKAERIALAEQLAERVPDPERAHAWTFRAHRKVRP